MEIPISKIWATRFHQNSEPGVCQTNDWVFYVSRPTLELLRKPGREGTAAYQAIKSVVKDFLEKNSTSIGFSDPFSVRTTTGHRHDSTEVYCTLSYPFDIRDEIDNKLGVVIHAAIASEAREDQIQLSIEDRYPSMFDAEFNSRLEAELSTRSSNDTENLNPPGVRDSDPMWREFASSKLLPTDQLLSEITFGRFRNIVSHQYIEVRLHKSRSIEKSSSREQLDALQRFASSSSGFTNFSGPPGTGKSTLLHMVCAHRLFQNFRERAKDRFENIPEEDRTEKTKILYYLHSQTLRDEAIREVKSILEEVYMPILKVAYSKTYKNIIAEIEQSIEYVNQEQLISSNITPNPNRNILSDASNNPLMESLGRNSPSGLRPILKRGLRNIVFGMFGTAQNYQQWKRKIGDWNGHVVNFHRPNSGRAARNHALVMKDFLHNEPNSKIKNHLHEFEKRISSLVDKNLLWNGTDDKQFWDPSCLFYLSSEDYKLQGPDSLWERLQNKVDWIVIDEVQDTSILEVRILLDHFSNRIDGQEYRDFRLIVAGDENQNVNHLLYQPQNRHFGFAFDSWAQYLKETGGKTQETFRLSQNLTNELSVLLKSGYRVFNQMFPFANDILNTLRVHHAETGAKLGKVPVLTETNYGRDGVFVRLNGNVKKNQVNYLEKWQNSILGQLRKQMLTTIDENEAFEPTSAEPIRVAFTYDKDDFNHEYSEEGLRSPFTKRLMTKNAYINDFAENVDVLMGDFVDAFEKWHNEETSSSKEAMLDEMRQALQLRGIMDVSSIKGLTMPVSLILPSQRLTEGERQETMEDLSKFLVQITRAQYFNIIIEDTRSFSRELGDDSVVKPKDWKDEDIGEWLEAVLNHSAGFDHAFNRIFQKTMQQYDSKMLWVRLKKESNGIDPELEFLIDWLHDLLWNLKHDDDFDPEQWESHYLDMDNQQRPKGIKSIRGKTVQLEENRRLEQEYMLGDHRFGEQDLSSLRLFLMINRFLCTRTALSTGATHKSKIGNEKLAEAITRWVNHLDDSNQSERKTVDWLKLFANPKHDPNNLICQAVEKTFDSESPQWPQEPQPRLYMGGWRIGNTTRYPSNQAEDNDLGRYAWMEDDSAFFNIRPEALEWAIIDKLHIDHSYNSKLRLFLGLTSLNVPMSTNALVDVISGYNSKEGKDILDWFVKMFTEASDSGKKEYTRFKEEVRESLEQDVSGNPKCQEALTEYLSQITRISDFKKTLEAFGFKDWKSCIRGRDMFQSVINMAYDGVMPVLELMDCHEQLHKITTSKRPDAIQNELSARHRFEDASNRRLRYIEGNLNSILVDLGLEQKELEFGFEKGRARGRTAGISYNSQEIIDVIKNTDLSVDGPIRMSGGGGPVSRAGILEWRESLEPFNDSVESALETLRQAEQKKAEIEAEYRGMTQRKREQLEDIRQRSELFNSEQIMQLKNEKTSYPSALQIYEEVLVNPFQRTKQNQMFKFFESQLNVEEETDTGDAENGAIVEHWSWFNLLWGLDAMLSGTYSGMDFKDYPFKFPSTRGDLVGKIHALVDAYCHVDSSSIKQLNNLIQDGLRPDPTKITSTALVNGFMGLMESLKSAYSDESKKELTYLNQLYQGERLAEAKTLRNKIYGTFMRNHADDVQVGFLSYLTNQIGKDEQCILTQQETRTYMTSSQARFVYSTITGEFLPNLDEKEMLMRWANLSWKKTQYTRLVDDKDNFADRVALNEASSAAQESAEASTPLLHSIWFHPSGRKTSLQNHFNNAATYRAFACIALDRPERAVSEFRQSGLHNHAAAIKLHMAFEASASDPRYELLTAVRDLCADEIELYHTAMFSDYTHVSADRRAHNQAYRFCIGPQTEQRYKVKTTSGGHAFSRDVSLSKKWNLSGTIDIDKARKGPGGKARWFLPLMEHAHRIEHAELLHWGLHEIERTSSSPDDYVGKFRTFLATNGDRFTMYRDDVTTRKNERGLDELVDNRYRFKWKWNPEPIIEQRGGEEVVVRKAGYQPSREDGATFSGKNMVAAFIEEFLDRKNILDHATLLIRLEEITGVSGATLGYLNPNRCVIDFSSAQEQAEILDRGEKAKRAVDSILERLQSEQVYSANRSALRKLKNARNLVRDLDYTDALAEINDSTLNIKHIQEFEIAIKPLIKDPEESDDS